RAAEAGAGETQGRLRFERRQPMSCEEARQNAAAYALGALTDAEAEEFERHIAGCDADHGLASFTQAADRLAEAAPEMTPPDGLRSRIIAAAEAHLATESAIAGAAST